MVKKILYITVLLLISILLVYIACETSGWFSDNKKIVFEINSGDSFEDIAENLNKFNIIGNKKLFVIYSKITGRNQLNNVKTGYVELSADFSYRDILAVLTNDKRINTSIKVTVPEGYNLEKIKNLLTEKELISPEKFDDTISDYDLNYEFIKNLDKSPKRLEGYLFPDTYYFTKDDDEIKIIDTMLSRFEEIINKYDDEINSSGYSLHEIIILSSIIEKEGGSNEEFRNVSSVFHNRLKRNDNLSYLQSCATVQYILNTDKPILSNSDIAVDSPYNTHKYKGLPIGPIASPGETAIKAALSPADTDYLYFLNDKDGILHFTDNYNEHLNNIRKYQ